MRKEFHKGRTEKIGLGNICAEQRPWIKISEPPAWTWAIGNRLFRLNGKGRSEGALLNYSPEKPQIKESFRGINFRKLIPKNYVNRSGLVYKGTRIEPRVKKHDFCLACVSWRFRTAISVLGPKKQHFVNFFNQKRRMFFGCPKNLLVL